MYGMQQRTNILINIKLICLNFQPTFSQTDITAAKNELSAAAYLNIFTINLMKQLITILLLMGHQQ